MKRRPKLSFGESIFQTVNYTVATLFALLCIYPFYYIFIYSLSNAREAGKGNLILLPVKFTLKNYTDIMGSEGFVHSFGVSMARTVLATLITLFFTSLFAYVMTHQELPFRKLFYRMTVISMYLSAGLIPWYMTMWMLGLKNNFLLYILPGAVSAYYLILIKTYIESIPAELSEAAKIDGAGLLRIFFNIIIPLCTPILAAVAVFSAVSQGNSWYDNIMLVNNPDLATLQYKLLTILNQADNIAKKIRLSGGGSATINTSELTRITPMSVRMTATMIVTIPIILVYPMLQRFFVKGIMLGAVKG
jgi:ABC-type glycerol-3-phosphate transport system permease component